MDNIKQILKESKNIVVIGASNNSRKAAHRIPKYLKEEGYNIIPINPNSDEVLDELSYNSLSEVPKEIKIDIVNIFRPSKDIPYLMEQVVKRFEDVGDLKLVWLQEGIHDKEAKVKAKELGINYVESLCIFKVHATL